MLHDVYEVADALIAYEFCNADDALLHYGTKYHSGRYPYGSGENPYQHDGTLLSRISQLRSEGLSETEIARELEMSTTEYRKAKSIATEELRSFNIDTAKSLSKDGLGPTEIAKRMSEMSGKSINESTVRSWLRTDVSVKANKVRNTADFLKDKVDEAKMIDVGSGVEAELGISSLKKTSALKLLEEEGYKVRKIRVEQQTNPGNYTTMSVLCAPGVEYSDVYKLQDIGTVTDYTSDDDGQTFRKFHYPKSMDSKRIYVRYGDQGGSEMDGVVQLRRNVPDLSLGGSRYSQVRILVDDNKYIKGMAVYSDDIPKGYDLVFNTNKPSTTSKLDVFKDIKENQDNPFGSYIKANGQSTYVDENGKTQLSLINKRSDEGDWGDWSKNLPSQFLAKQNYGLVKQQLDLSINDAKKEYSDILALENPTVKRKLLQTFSDECDSAAVHLQAAALPRQSYQVILPGTSLKDTECFAPNYRDGEKVALIRYPHGGTFEIPIVTVNNKNAECLKTVGIDAKDAVGINAKVAAQLSGADFDGDTVMVIPVNDKVSITATRPLQGLADFDPKIAYATKEVVGKDGEKTYFNESGIQVSTMHDTQNQMGRISNLITDMTLKGASTDELARAVRHSMVVIDAEKHHLDYKQSEKDNGIAELKNKYQLRYNEETGKYSTSAATLLSRAGARKDVPRKTGNPHIDPDTGKYVYTESQLAPQYYTDKNGKTKLRTVQSTQMAETDDARTLVSDVGNSKEMYYAHYANEMKALANQARKEKVSTGRLEYSRDAAREYSSEVQHLISQLNQAKMNAPRERAAQRMAASKVKALKQANPDLTRGEVKKLKDQSLADARAVVGAKRRTITISDSEWEAIQAGAIHDSKLDEILKYADIDEVREKATPRQTRSELSSSEKALIKAMAASGYSNADIAKRLGVSTSTVQKYR